jgi:hypothetical protein
MATANFLWADTVNFDVSVPVFPSVTVTDFMTIPPGMAGGTGSWLVLAVAHWDSTFTTQGLDTAIPSHVLPTITYVSAATGIEYAAGTKGFSYDTDRIAQRTTVPLHTNHSVGGQFVRSYYQTQISGVPGGPSPAELNAGGFFRCRSSADLAAVTDHFSVCATMAAANGTYASGPGFGSSIPADVGERTLLNGFDSGSLGLSSPAQRETVAVLVIASSASYFTLPNASPDFTSPGWVHVVSNHYASALWCGIGYLVPPLTPFPATHPFSFSIPNADSSNAQGEIANLAPRPPKAVPSRMAQVVG